MSIKKADPHHEVAYQDICKLVSKHAADLTPIELLAIASNMLGKLLALQDQRVTTPEIARETMVQNIECGNQQAVEQLMKNAGSA